MTEIPIKKPNTASPHKLLVDIVFRLPSAVNHLTRLRQDGDGLYDVPLTWKKGMDTHNSYEASGEMHGKITRGKLEIYPGGDLTPFYRPLSMRVFFLVSMNSIGETSSPPQAQDLFPSLL